MRSRLSPVHPHRDIYVCPHATFTTSTASSFLHTLRNTDGGTGMTKASSGVNAVYIPMHLVLVNSRKHLGKAGLSRFANINLHETNEAGIHMAVRDRVR